MRVFIQVLMVFIPLLINAQTPNRATLTLVQERGFNEFDMDLDVQLIGESDDTSRLTGSVQVEVNIIPGIPSTDQLTILNANVRGRRGEKGEHRGSGCAGQRFHRNTFP